jgi:hypothetical protein
MAQKQGDGHSRVHDRAETNARPSKYGLGESRIPRPLPFVGFSVARPVTHVYEDPDQSLRITVTYSAEISGRTPIKLRVNARTHEMEIEGDGFTLSDTGLGLQMQRFVGSNWASYFGNHVGASGSFDVSHPHDATFSVESGGTKLIRVGQGEFSFTADLAVHPLRWGQQLTYTESLSANVALPGDAGELVYSITVEIAPNPRPPRPGTGRRGIEIPAAEVAGAALLAGVAAAAYGRGVLGTRIVLDPGGAH